MNATTAFAIPDADECVRSARAAIKAIIELDDVLWDHRRQLIDRGLWLLTLGEPRRKHAIRYRSREVIDGAGEPRHEHVVPRDWLARGVMACPEHVDRFLDLAVACVVTVEEHNSLRRNDAEFFGWERYVKAGMVVCDAANGMRRVNLRKLAAEQRRLMTELPVVPPSGKRRRAGRAG